ncbi:MAG: diguanylate cyclase [Gammaproteobacteria bacterium]
MTNRYTPVRVTGCGVGLLLAALLLCLLTARAHAAAPVTIARDAAAVPAGYGWFDLLVDDAKRFSLNDLIRFDAAAGFAPATRDTVNRGFTDAAVWAHFTLAFDGARRDPLYLMLPRPLVDEIELVTVVGGVVTAREISGDRYPFSTRPFPHRSVVFELAPRPGEEVDYYVRVESARSSVGIGLRLLDGAALDRLVQVEGLVLGGFFGVLLALTLGALLLWLVFRQGIFGLYAAYASSFGLTLFAISGYGARFAWPQTPALQDAVPTVAVGLTAATGIAFLRRFLRVPQIWPTMDRVAVGLALLGLAGAALHLLTPGRAGMLTTIGVAVLTFPLAFVVFARCILRGDRVARYFLLGWLACAAGIILKAMVLAGLVAATPLTDYAVYLGAVAEFIALSTGVSDRLRLNLLAKQQEIARTNAELAELNRTLEARVAERTLELEQRNSELAELAIRDGLTGLYNHSAAIELLERILAQGQRYGFAVTALMLDVDHFKRINDTFGHQAGDRVLEVVARTLVDSVRDSDVVGRFGGEEFLIAMPHADAIAAREFGERLLTRLRTLDLPEVYGHMISASVGIAVCSPSVERCDAAQLIRRADEALYRSKRDGRDRLSLDAISVVAAEDDDRVRKGRAPTGG